MKFFEKSCLERLQNNEETPEVPLQNVRNALGHIGQTVGNPLTKTEINIQINSFIFTVAGALIAPGALPIGLQSSLPVFIFGLTDYYGGFLRLQRLIITNPAWTLLNPPAAALIQTGIVGYNAVPPMAPMFPFVQAGDMMMLYGDTPGGANFLVLIVIHCNNVSYGTFLNSFVSDLITISHIRYLVPIANIAQFVNPIFFGYQTLFGKTSFDSLDPRLYILGKDPQQEICDLPVDLPIDKNIMMGFQLNVNCQNVSLVLFVEKVEPLTHKRRSK
jgi:hypothetical protein